METINLGKADGLPPVDWAAVVEKLDARSAPASDAPNSRTTWLCTLNEDGSPHVTAVGALWVDGAFWFQTGAGTRKGRNVARDPRCSVAVSIRDADVVIDGDAAVVLAGMRLFQYAGVAGWCPPGSVGLITGYNYAQAPLVAKEAMLKSFRMDSRALSQGTLHTNIPSCLKSTSQFPMGKTN